MRTGLKKINPQTRTVSGFTLIEAVISIAVVAILAAIITPLVINNLRQAKLTKAVSDVQTLGKAMVQYRNDTGAWPLYRNAGNPAQLLFGDQDLDNNGVPDNSVIASSWDAVAAAGCLSFEHNLVANSSGIYPQGPSPSGSPCWNGPYISSVRLDPWGYPYVVNVFYLQGGAGFDATRRVWVLSSGPNKTTEALFSGSSPVPATSDDLVFRLQ